MLLRQLRAVDSDRHSGAAELALRAAEALQAWLQRCPRPVQQDLLDAAWRLCRTQSMMAPFRHLANFVALAADADAPSRYLTNALRAFAWTARHGPRRIARRFRAATSAGPNFTVVTFSYSSTVLRSLIAARRRVRTAYVSLASPENEGRTMAFRLAQAGVNTCLTTDVDLSRFLERTARALLVVGADQVRERDFVNRAGTDHLIRRSQACGVPAWVLADTTKLCSKARMGMGSLSTGWVENLLGKSVKNLRAYREILSPSPLARHVRVLTERDLLTPAQVRRAIAAIDVSARLPRLLD